jgi:NADPH2:quinone reductase
MKLIRQYEFGGPHTLRFEAGDDLVPGPGQVRIDVEAAGVHLIDTKIRAGEQYGPMSRPELPMTPGREVAGVVGALGAGVPGQWLKARVVAHLGQASGGYAAQAVAPHTSLHRLPDTVSSEHAVAAIGTGRTAMLTLRAARLSADDVVLVTSAAGGMGNLLAQSARHAGARVIAAAGGPAKLARVDADVKVDYREPGWADGLETTLVLDAVGGQAGKAALGTLKPGGRFVIYGWSSGAPTEITAWDVIGKGLSVSAVPRPDNLRELEEAALREVAQGRWVPLVQTFPLAEAAKAHEALETRATVGKTVLVP